MANGQIDFLTHYWLDGRFPDCSTVTKVGCNNIEKLIAWGQMHGLKSEWIDYNEHFPHFDLVGENQKKILEKEEQWDQIKKFHL